MTRTLAAVPMPTSLTADTDTAYDVSGFRPLNVISSPVYQMLHIPDNYLSAERKLSAPICCRLVFPLLFEISKRPLKTPPFYIVYPHLPVLPMDGRRLRFSCKFVDNVINACIMIMIIIVIINWVICS